MLDSKSIKTISDDISFDEAWFEDLTLEMQLGSEAQKKRRFIQRLYF